MSTIKSSAENLTLNADGANNDIKFQSNGSEVASIDQAGTITATTFTGAGSTPSIVDGGNATAMTIDSNENMGIGVVPESDWNATTTALQIGTSASLSAGAASSYLYVSSNSKYDGTDFKYINTNQATTYLQNSSGNHIFKVAPSGTADTAISWTDAMTIDNAGAVTMPAQPAFSVYANSAQNNLSTSYSTIRFDTERFDQNADFNTGTYTFTAPVTGKYNLNACVGLKSIPLNCNWIFMRIITSNAGYNMSTSTAQWDAGTASNYPTGFASSVLADMDAGDTASVDIYQYTGTVQTDVATGAGYTWFSGHLVA